MGGDRLHIALHVEFMVFGVSAPDPTNIESLDNQAILLSFCFVIRLRTA